MLADHDPPMLTSTVGQRVAFAAAIQTGDLVSQQERSIAAAREIAELADEIDQLGIKRAGLCDPAPQTPGFAARAR